MISDEFHPQVVISCLDMWQIDWIEHAKLSNAVTNIGYISIYGSPVPLSWKKVVKNLDLAICYSEFGKDVLKGFMPFTSIDMIPLGVDSYLYRPLENGAELKAGLGIEGKFVVGCISRNQVRKRLDKLIEGFALFAEKKEDVRLFVKTEAVSEHGTICRTCCAITG
jgi:glycosyltransferase involved in cell wall biosynthesis